jgi:hypothetical protein
LPKRAYLVAQRKRRIIVVSVSFSEHRNLQSTLQNSLRGRPPANPIGLLYLGRTFKGCPAPFLAIPEIVTDFYCQA